MTDDDLPRLPLAEVAALVRARKVSATDVVDATLRRIQRLEPLLNSFITVAADSARQQARVVDARIQAGEPPGPLAGIPIAFKDCIVTRGILTTAGSPALKDWIPVADATVVRRLVEAGAIVIGKNTLWEFAFGGPHPDYGDARNPWDAERTCGGSSSGSGASVAAGLSYAALGTDTAGSVRCPAAMCGLVGVKPTYGRVSRSGVLPVSYSLDHVAPLARTVEDVALILNVLAGEDPSDPTTSPRPVPDFTATLEDGVRGVRLGVVAPDQSEELEPQVGDALQAAYALLEGEGATLIDVSLPPTAGAAGIILDAEAADAHRHRLRTRPTDYGPFTRTRFEVAEFTPATDYIRAHRVRQRAIEATQAVFEQVDAILLPSVVWGAPGRFAFDPASATEADRKKVGMPGGISVSRHTSLFNLTGHPALSVPCGISAEGFPIGLQIAGPYWGEAQILRIARSYERITPWHRQVPPRVGRSPDRR